MAQRETFMEENAELLERCCAIPSAERKGHMRKLVTRARAHFGYSEKTIAQDILRPVLKAYSAYIASKAEIAPRIVLHGKEPTERDSEMLPRNQDGRPMRRDL